MVVGMGNGKFPLTIGVLALQGAFAKHQEVLMKLGAHVIQVRTPGDLEKCDGLVIPGGESTTIFRQMNFIHLIPPLREFAAKKPVFGTCAGLILMSQEILGETLIKPLNLLDLTIERNAYGRQIDSFSTELEISDLCTMKKVAFVYFIRAPRIKRFGPNVRVLASRNSEPVLVQQGFHLGSTFHPELGPDTVIHEYFLSLVHNSVNH